jgi:ZIP family zinc transporter
MISTETSLVVETALAGLLASLACGVGVLPLFVPGVRVEKFLGEAYALAGGLMTAASAFALLAPALDLQSRHIHLSSVPPVLSGLAAGAWFIWFVESRCQFEHFAKSVHARAAILVFIAMTVHSIPEGLAVGVGYGAEQSHYRLTGLGRWLAVVIALHNMPEGLAVALPLRAAGGSLRFCFGAAFLTSLPQPIAAVPAMTMVSLFSPLVVPALGFAAGAMLYLVQAELVPTALKHCHPQRAACCFLAGLSLMILIQGLV